MHTLAWKTARNSVLCIVCDALMCSEIVRCTFNEQRSDPWGHRARAKAIAFANAAPASASASANAAKADTTGRGCQLSLVCRRPRHA